MKALNENYPLNTNKNILLALSKFKAEKFNEVLLEVLFDEKINEFLGKISKLENEEYRNELTAFHAKIFLVEKGKSHLDLE